MATDDGSKSVVFRGLDLVHDVADERSRRSARDRLVLEAVVQITYSVAADRIGRRYEA